MSFPKILDPAAGPRWSFPESICLLLWCVAAAYAVRVHVPWADESQAWMLAQENSWAQLFGHALHYEGTGGLWHAFLKLLQALHISFTGARYLAAAVQAGAVAVLLRYAPFPRVLTLLLPFTFFLFFQDAVIARSYCLFALLAFPAAVLLRSPKPHPAALALLAGLLANLSVHGVLLGAGLLAVALHRKPRLQQLRIAPETSQAENAAQIGAIPKMGRVPALLLALPFFLFAAVTMAPAPDLDFQAGGNLHNSLAKAVRPLGIHLTLTPSVAALPYAGLQPAPVPTHPRRGTQAFLNRAGRVLGVLTFPVSRFRALALLTIAALVAQAVRAGRKAGLIPWALMAAVFSSLYLAPRHVGTLFTGLIVTTWLTWPTPEQAAADPRLRRLTRTAAALFILIAVEQTGWTVHALLSECTRPYSPARMTARFLQANEVGQEQTAAGYLYFSSAPLLYFPRNIYVNQPPHRFWLWSTRLRDYQSVQQTLALHPRVIVVSTLVPGPDADVSADWLAPNPPAPGVVLGDQFRLIPFWEDHGYRRTRLFCGRSLMRASYAEQLCDMVLERK